VNKRIAVGLMLLLATASAPPSDTIGADSLRATDGQCTAVSHIAEGPADSDLTRRQVPFRCDNMVTSMVDGQPGHFMATFGEKRAVPVRMLAFGGFFVGGGEPVMEVKHVYFEPGVQTAADEGLCKFFMDGGHIKSVMCGAVSVKNGWKKAAVIVFEVRAG
jgi:hypothetical protein